MFHYELYFGLYFGFRVHGLLPANLECCFQVPKLTLDGFRVRYACGWSGGFMSELTIHGSRVTVHDSLCDLCTVTSATTTFAAANA